MTVEIELNDADFKALSEYAQKNKISLPQFFLESAREKIHSETIGNEELFRISDKIISQRKKVYEVIAK